MNMTLFDTPVINSFCHWLSRILLKISGWRVTGKPPETKKCVMVCAPHTSNWDFLLSILVILKIKKKIYWMGKKELFRIPFGWFMKWMGGIPVDRGRSSNFVSTIVDIFNSNESFTLAVAPEGSRSKVNSWKTGFYYISSGAKVPIMLCSLDYEKKEACFGPLFIPTGNLEVDMGSIMNFFRDVRGKNN